MENKIKRISISLIFLLIPFFVAIVAYRDSILDYFTPKLEQIGDVHVLVKNDSTYITSKLVIKNKSFLKINIDSIKYKVSIFNNVYLKSEEFLGIILPKHGNDTIRFSLKIPSAAIVKKIKSERKKTDSATYAIDVSLLYSTLFGNGEIPINKSARFKIPHPPELKITEIQWKKIRLKKLEAIAHVKIINYGPVTLIIKDLKYSMIIPNQGTLKGIYKKQIKIKPKDTTLILLPISIDVKHIGKTLFKIAINRDVYHYTLTLNADLESSAPLQQAFQIDLIKKGQIELRK